MMNYITLNETINKALERTINRIGTEDSNTPEKCREGLIYAKYTLEIMTAYHSLHISDSQEVAQKAFLETMNILKSKFNAPENGAAIKEGFKDGAMFAYVIMKNQKAFLESTR